MPEIAIIGRQNVGKSTLFNSLIGKKIAIAYDQPGVTRDLIRRPLDWGEGSWGLTDFPGLENIKKISDQLTIASMEKALSRVEDYHLILWVVSAGGLEDYELELLTVIRKLSRPVWMVINFADDPSKDNLPDEYYQSNAKKYLFVSALNKRNIGELRREIVRFFSNFAPEKETAVEVTKPLPEESTETDPPHIAIIGKPNTGKSTFYNRLLQKEVSLVSEISGTTRDVLESVFNYRQKSYILLDTAGMRKKNKIRDKIERYSVHVALENTENADITMILADATEGVDRQNKSIIALMKRRGKAIILVLNKADLISPQQKSELEEDIKFLQKQFWPFPYFFISGMTGKGVGMVLKKMESMAAQEREIRTYELNKILEKLTQASLIQNAGIKINYITYGKDGSRFILFGNRQTLPASVQRYLEKKIPEELNMREFPFQVEYRRK